VDKVERREFSLKERAEILKKTDCKCAHCGIKLVPETMTVEHIYPLDRGGDHSEFNLVALCKGCNSSKSNYIYEIDKYYKYIEEEYLEKYMLHNIKEINKHSNIDDILDVSTMVYQVVSGKVHVMASQMRNKKKAHELLNNCAIKLKLEKAYPADAERISDFLNKQLTKRLDRDETDGLDGLKMYDNQYKILNTIREGQVLTLTTCNGTIHGVFAFENASEIKVELNQLNAITEQTGMYTKYIMTLGVISDKAFVVYQDIMSDFLTSFINKNVIPLYFNIINKNYGGSTEVIALPCEIKYTQGTIEFFTIKELRKIIKRSIDAVKNTPEFKGILTEERVERAVEDVIYGKENLVTLLEKLRLEGEKNGKNL
jgi:hypothetical protein